uniref:Uncharacterized protein n=1 Tax=Rhizophora mucronata TaxID=61149 RepID=A0A2P2NK60_RHIMU
MDKNKHIKGFSNGKSSKLLSIKNIGHLATYPCHAMTNLGAQMVCKIVCSFQNTQSIHNPLDVISPTPPNDNDDQIIKATTSI